MDAEQSITVYPLDEPAPGYLPVFHLRVDMDTSTDPEAFRVAIDFAGRLESVAVCDALVEALTAASRDIGAYVGERATALSAAATRRN